MRYKNCISSIPNSSFVIFVLDWDGIYINTEENYAEMDIYNYYNVVQIELCDCLNINDEMLFHILKVEEDWKVNSIQML